MHEFMLQTATFSRSRIEKLAILVVGGLLGCCSLASCGRPVKAPLPTSKPVGESIEPQPVTAASTSQASLPAAIANPELAAVLANRDAKRDGWDTEVANDEVGEQLNRLAAIIFAASDFPAEQLDAVLSEDVRVGQLKSTDSETVFADASFQVRRSQELAPAEQSGRSAAGDKFAALRQTFAPEAHVHTKFKVVRVALDASRLETEVYFLADGPAAAGVTQINATWHAQWRQADQDQLPLLIGLQVTDYEEISGPRHLFDDCTVSVLSANDSFAQQLLKSTNYWRANLQGALGVDLFGHQGLAIGDVNGDRLDDLYVCQPGGIPNRLYQQLPDGTALDISADGAR